MPKESVTLYFKEGSSDKVYQANIEERGDKCVVTFAYGRRGTALNAGTKTDAPVSYDEAKKIYDKLVREKTAKGYKPGEGEDAPANVAAAVASKEERDTGLRPQLLNPVEEADAMLLLNDPDFWAQEKFNGKRCLLKKTGDEVIGTNRMGLAIALPAKIADYAKRAVADNFIIDGELLGDSLVAFDILSLNGRDVMSKPYDVRLPLLSAMFDSIGAIRSTETALTTKHKRELYEQLKKENAEGIVFKRKDAKYSAGRPNTGGSQLKFKFYATCSAIVVEGRAGKRSVALALLDDKSEVAVGNVTVPANQAIPKVGQLVEVRYLYAYKGGSLYQPTLLGIRDDIGRDACKLSQLKYIQENADADEA